MLFFHRIHEMCTSVSPNISLQTLMGWRRQLSQRVKPLFGVPVSHIRVLAGVLAVSFPIQPRGWQQLAPGWQQLATRLGDMEGIPGSLL